MRSLARHRARFSARRARRRPRRVASSRSSARSAHTSEARRRAMRARRLMADRVSRPDCGANSRAAPAPIIAPTTRPTLSRPTCCQSTTFRYGAPRGRSIGERSPSAAVDRRRRRIPGFPGPRAASEDVSAREMAFLDVGSAKDMVQRSRWWLVRILLSSAGGAITLPATWSGRVQCCDHLCQRPRRSCPGGYRCGA